MPNCFKLADNERETRTETRNTVQSQRNNIIRNWIFSYVYASEHLFSLLITLPRIIPLSHGPQFSSINSIIIYTIIYDYAFRDLKLENYSSR